MGRIPLATWIWRSYARTALVPLSLVEVVLIAIYIQTNYWTRQANIDALRQEATGFMQRIVDQEAEQVSRQLHSVTQLTELYRQQAALALATPARPGLEKPDRYALAPNGVYQSRRNDGGSAVYYSGLVPVGPAEQEKVRRSAALDPLMKQIKALNPLVVQIYLNTRDSMNRIFPYTEGVTQFPAKMDITRFNFYYEADAAHDPTRAPVWTDVYLDPAGQGWLASCIAPVYQGDVLEAVVGLDVTVGTIARRVLDLQLPWGAYGVLVGKNGSLIAMPKAGEADFGLAELLHHHYQQVVGQDTFKPDTFNLFKRPQLQQLATRLTTESSGLAEADIGGPRLLAWQRIGETGWTFLMVAAPERIFASAMDLSQRLERIAYGMIGALVLFYLLFFLGLFFRARVASRAIAEPLKAIENMMLGIGQARYEQTAPEFNVQELHQTARELSRMGRDLWATHRALLTVQQRLREHVNWLNAVFRLSPDGLVTFDREGRVSQANPAFFALTGFTLAEVEGWNLARFWCHIAGLTPPPGPPAPFPPRAGDSIPLQFIRPKARTLHCQVQAFDESDQDEISSGAVIVYFQDVTREAELDRMKSEFLATAAHELRTPLTLVVGYSELLATGQLEPAFTAELAASILNHGRQLEAIVTDLLDLSRLEAGAGRDFAFVRQPLGPLVARAVQVDAAVRRQALHLENLAELGGTEVQVDGGALRLALVKVLDNAATYSLAGTTIRVRLRRSEAGAPPEIGVEIADQGIGMSPEQVERVGARFYRADTSGAVPGTGLGMSIVENIVSLHHGHLEIASILGRGTAVTLWLPLAGDG
jgi:signal transduction histidine kinase